MTVENIQKQLMKLDANSRAKLASMLLSSLDVLTEEENERLWAEEAFQRHNDLMKSSSKSKPAHIVFKNARARLK